jgi:hypothetical protein
MIRSDCVCGGVPLHSLFFKMTGEEVEEKKTVNKLLQLRKSS